MKASQPKELRLQSQVERGLAAQRLVDDEFVTAWFDEHRSDLVKKMLGADIGDDQTRRDAAIQIKTLDALRRHISSEASLGRKAKDDQRKLTDG